MTTHHSTRIGEGPTLIGNSAVMTRLRADIAAAARTSAKVLILGETGVGKEVVARLIHDRSARAARSFVAVNCSGIPETLLESELFGHVRGSFTGAFRDKAGLVEQANRGTLFLDELGEMSLRMQAAVLRFTETGEVQRVGGDGNSARSDVRLITATNRDLRARIADGNFREDLFYRLNVIQIQIPPLRERGEDVLLLLEHYLAHAAAAHSLRTPQLTPDAAQLLLAYAWPGNVRELRNVTERLVVHDRPHPVAPEDLPMEIRKSSGVHQVVAASPAVVDERAAAISAVDNANQELVEAVWARLEAGEDFWVVVHGAFKARELTRLELLALVDRGLRQTRGSYRRMLKVFNLAPADYKRLHAFLYQQRCNLPVAPYRGLKAQGDPLTPRADSPGTEGEPSDGVDDGLPTRRGGLYNRSTA